MGTVLLSLPISLLSLILLANLPSSAPDPDYAALVYKGCGRQPISDPSGLTSQALSTVTGALVSHSTNTKFYKTTAGAGPSAVSGLFQCRGDLTTADCYNCVSRLPILIDKLCGRPIAARVHLRGCYMLYQLAGFPQISGMDMLYKTCAGGTAGIEFQQLRDNALSAAANSVAGNGFYATNYRSVYVLAQCEGDLGSADCAGCVKTAVLRAQSDCGNSIAAQIYLNRCFLSYKYYANGVSIGSSFSSSGHNTPRTVAIIVGGIAAVGFLVIFLLFIRGLMKKHDGD